MQRFPLAFHFLEANPFHLHTTQTKVPPMRKNMSDMFNVWGGQMRHERNCKPIMQKQIFATLEFRVCGFPLAFYLLEGITSDFTQPIRKFRRLENRCPTWFNAWGGNDETCTKPPTSNAKSNLRDTWISNLLLPVCISFLEGNTSHLHTTQTKIPPIRKPMCV